MKTTEFLEWCLCTKRPADSLGEAKFVRILIQLLGNKVTAVDSAGNIHCDLREKDTKTIFTAHTDTCARDDFGPNQAYLDGDYYRTRSDVLGADNGAGMSILYHLMKHEVPGYYIFCRGEECGGESSRWLASNMPELLSQFDRAIAFDRRGTCDVVHQMMVGETASEQFAEALSDALNAQGLLYAPSRMGSFTDLANWIGSIPECVNVSVGYDHEHGPQEALYVPHFLQLADAAVAIDWEGLAPVRRPAPKAKSSVWGGKAPWEEVDDSWQLDDDFWAAWDEAQQGDFRAMRQLVAEHTYPDNTSLALNSMRKVIDPIVLGESANMEVEAALDYIFEELTR